MPIPNTTSRTCESLVHLFPAPSSHSRDFIRENKQRVRDKSKQQQTNFTAAQLATQARKHVAPSSSGLIYPRNIGTTDHLDRNPVRGSMSTYIWQPSSMVQSVDKMRQKTAPKVATQRRNVKPKAASVRTRSIAIQTDEIQDELYLYSALKKCASAAFKNTLRTKFLQKDEEENQKKQQQHLSLENEKETGEARAISNAIKNATTEQAKALEKPSPHKAPHQNDKLLKQGSQQNYRLESPRYTHTTISGEHSPQANAEVNDNFNVMSLPPEMKSTCNKTGTCTNCPEGYHLLTEKERDHIKSKLLERERVFIKQLNSFPLAIETLRVRQCKTRIERELSTIEQNLRKLTKRKIYAKINE